jgi:hypothetical protein
MKCTITAFGKDVPIVLSTTKYEGGRTAVVATVKRDGERWGVATVNMPEVPLSEKNLIVKTWSENEHWVPQLLTLLPKHFKDTGLRVRAGYAQAQIWVFSEDGNL